MNRSGENTAYREKFLQFIEEVSSDRVNLKVSLSSSAENAKAVKALRRNVRYLNLKDAKAVIRGKYTLKGISSGNAEKITSVLKKYGVETKITKSDQMQEIPVVRHKVPVPGMVLSGTVRNVTRYGVFIDIGPGPMQFGLLHRRFFPRAVEPGEAVRIGDRFLVRVVSTNPNFNRIYFGFAKKWTPDLSMGAKTHADLSLDELNLSERTCKCLKRAGLNTVEDLRPYYPVLRRLMKVRNLSMDELNLTLRTRMCLERAGVNNLVDLFRNYPTSESLVKVRNLGRKGSEELIQMLKSKGILYPIEAE